MMDTLTQVERLIELAIIQRSELRRLVEELPQLKAHLSEEIERTFEETEPQLRAELEDWTTKQTADKTAALGVALEAKIAEHAASLPGAVKEIVSAELARFPRAGEIDQLRKEFAEPKSLNPRGKWVAGETYNKLDLVTINGDSYVSNIDGNTEKPSRSAGNWTLNAARGNSGGGGGITALNDLLGNPSAGDIVGSEGNNYVRKTLTAGTGITITDDPSTITIDASGAQEMLTATVKNAESVAITRGQVVYLFSATGGFPSVKLAYNTSDATSAKTFGVVSDVSIAPNGTGTITCVGVVSNLNLGAYNDGDTVYLGATPGSFTATKPYAPNHLVYVGIIERANAGNGELYVRVQNGYELDEIHDVQINSPLLAGQTLIYDATTDLWKNARLTAGVGVSISNGDSAITISADGGVNYQGTWNASTNTPTLTSSVGTKGFYYVVSVAGSTNLNGVTDWKVGDWAIFNGTAWEKVDTTDQVSSVFGRTGAVVGVSTDYSSVGITNTAIGATNPSTGAFTSLSATGNLTASGTGPHTFSGRLNITNTSGNVSLVQGAGAAGSNYGLRVQAGLNASDYGLFVTDSTSTSGYFVVRGDGSAKAFNGFEVGGNLTVSGSAASTIEGTLGLNCTPVTWYDNANLGTALQIGAGAGIYAFNTTGNTQLRLYNNAYLDNGGAEKYLTTGEAFVFEALGGEFRWKYASSGTAGNAVTLGRVMSLLGNGNLIVGSGSVDGGQKLQVSGTASITGNLTVGGQNLNFGGTGNSFNDIRLYDSTATGGTTRIRAEGGGLKLFVYDTLAMAIASDTNATFAGTGRFNGAAAGAVLNLKETASVPTAFNLTNRNSTQTWSVAVDGASVDDKLLAFIESGSVRWSLAATTGNATLSGNLTVNGTGTSYIGGSRSSIIGGSPRFQIESSSAPYYTSSIALIGNANSSGNEAVVMFSKSRGTTNGSVTAVQSGDTIGGLYWTGADGTSLNTNAAAFLTQVDGAVSTGSVPLRYIWQIAASEKMRLNSSGNLGIGTTNPISPLTVNGSATVDGTITSNRFAPTGALLINNGLYGSTTTQARLLLSGGPGNFNTNSAWYFGVQNTAGVGGPNPYLDIGLAALDSGTGFNAFTSLGRFFSNGNFFIGASPVDGGQKLQVSGTAYVSGDATFAGNVGVGSVSTNTDEGGALAVRKYVNRNLSYHNPAGYYAASLGKVNNTYPTVWASIDADYAQGSAVSAGLYLKSYYADANGSAAGYTIKNLVSGNPLVFSSVATATSPSGSSATENERMRLTNAGDLQLGTSSVTGARLVVVGPASASSRTAIIRSVTAGDKTYSAGLFSKYDNDSTTSQVFVQFSINNDGTASGQINANGASQAAFGSWSDARLKKNIVSLGSQWNAIKSLRPVEFDYIESEGGGHQIGFIAQEVQPIYSDVVGTRPDGMFTLSGMGKNEARLIKALQEAMLRIEALEAKLA